MADLLDTTTAGSWKPLGTAAATAGWRVVSNQGNAALRVQVQTAAPAAGTYKGRTVQPGDHLAVPVNAGETVYVHCSVAQDVVS